MNITLDLPDMQAIGQRIAARLQIGDIVALEGDLGAGKTTLARAIISACGHLGEVPSPTFTILEAYADCSPPLVHADFYRLDHPDELRELGLEDYRAGAALIAEWPERAGGFTWDGRCLSVALESVGECRRAIVKPGTAWQGRWP